MRGVRYAIRLRPFIYVLGMTACSSGAVLLLGKIGLFLFWVLTLGSATLCAWVFHLPRKRLALHEAAHAVAAWWQTDHPHVLCMTIRFQQGMVRYASVGHEWEILERASKAELYARLVTTLAGIAIERHLYGSPNICGSSDLSSAELIARTMGKRFAGRTSKVALESALADAHTLVVRYEHDIHRLAHELDRNHRLGYDQVRNVLGPRPSAD
jgi:hypothetical protein